MRITAVYAAEMVVCSLILLGGYRLAKAPSVQWAIVSVAMVLQPGLKESLAVSMNRIAANLIGATVGLAVGLLIGDQAWQFILAVVAVIFLCSRLGMEQSLRSACVAVTIVMLSGNGNVVASGIERAVSVVVGCGVALMVEYGAGWMQKFR